VPPYVKILRLKCTKFDFRWGTALDPAGELTTEGKKRGQEDGEERRGREREVEFTHLFNPTLTTGYCL